MENNTKFVLPTEEEKDIIRRRLGTSKKDIEQVVTIIRTWLEAQTHLPHVMDDDRIERMYISCKCRIEKVKKALDAYYTIKNKFPEYVMHRDPLSQEFREGISYMSLFTSPRLLEDCYRVGCLWNFNPDPTDFDVVKIAKAVLMGFEFFTSFDYCVGYIFVVDIKNLSAGHVMKIGIRDVRALEFIVTRAYSKRIIGIHFINAAKVIDMLLSIITPALSEKLQKRLFTHLPGSQTVFNYIPKEYLPNEMGGTAGPIRTVMDSITEEVIGLRDWFLEEDKCIADESKRPKDCAYQYELFGVDGSFKKLQID